MDGTLAPDPTKPHPVLQQLIQELGAQAKNYTPDQLADAAFGIIQHQKAQNGPQQPVGTPNPQPGLPDTTQRADASQVNVQSLHAPKPSFQQHVEDLAGNIADMIGNGANALRFALTNTTGQNTGQMPQKYGSTAGIGDVATTQATQDPARLTPNLTPEGMESVKQGAGLWASMAVGGAASELLPVVKGVTNKATNYLIANYLGAATYQAATPNAPGESTLQHVFGQPAATMALAGATVEGLGAALTKQIPWKEPIVGIFPASKQAAVVEGGQLAHDLATATAEAEKAPPPSTPQQRSGDALRSLTDEQLAAHPLGTTPPLDQSNAAPGNLEHQVATVERRARARMSAETVQQALKQQAIEVAVAHTPTVTIASPELQSAVQDAVANPATKDVGELATRALGTPDPDAHFAQHIGDHVDIPPATQLPPLTGEVTPGSLPSLNIAQALQFAAKSQDQLDQIVAAAKTFREQATQETAAKISGVAGFAARPLVLGVAGVGTSAIGDQVEDDHPGLGSLLHTVGRLMETAGVLSIPGEFWQRSKWASNVIGSLDATVALTQPGARASAEQIGKMLNFHSNQAEMLRRDLTKAFPDEASQRALAYIGGPNWNQSAHWESLSKPQQDAATAIVQGLHRDLAGVAQAAGVMGAARENYMPLGFNRKWYDSEFRGNPATATAALSQSGSWAKNRVFPDLATAEEWVKGKGLDPEQVLNHNGIDLTVHHFQSVMRALDNKALTDAMQHLGYLQPKQEVIGGTTNFTPNVPGWRDVNLPGWTDHTAPNAVATLLENMAKGPVPSSGIAGAYDMISGLATRAVIYNRFIHGLNLVRENLFAGVGMDGYSRAAKQLTANDPGILEAAQHNVQVLRGPIAPRAAEAIDNLLAAGGHGDLTTKALTVARGFIAGGDKVQDMIGTTALAVWNKERAKFVTTHPDIQPGSAAWDTNMDRIGAYANDVAGRVPNYFRSQGAQKFMSRVFLAPQWMETRWNLMRKGLIDEPSTVLNGGLPPTDALYSKFKMRQLLLVAGGTAALSYALSGKPPEFNPQTGKFYAKTGLQDDRGNDIGFDPWGFGQDELTLFGSQSPAWPLTYLNRKTSPLINVATQLKFGRNYQGTELSPGEAAENAFSNLGGMAQGAEYAAKTGIGLAQGQSPSAANVVRGAASAAGLGGFSTLPSDNQAVLSSYAAKILQNDYGVPPTAERVWNLTRMMMSDARRSGNKTAFGYLSMSYVANEQRQLQNRSPMDWIWNHAKAAFNQMVQ